MGIYGSNSYSSFLTALDKYITAEPNLGYDSYGESVAQFYTDEFVERYEIDNPIFVAWEDKLCDKEVEPHDAAKIIMRATQRYLSAYMIIYAPNIKPTEKKGIYVRCEGSLFKYFLLPTNCPITDEKFAIISHVIPHKDSLTKKFPMQEFRVKMSVCNYQTIKLGLHMFGTEHYCTYDDFLKIMIPINQ